MPVIKPISDLRNKANEISDLAHKLNEPIFITKNGEGDMVVMSIARPLQQACHSPKPDRIRRQGENAQAGHDGHQKAAA